MGAAGVSRYEYLLAPDRLYSALAPGPRGLFAGTRGLEGVRAHPLDTRNPRLSRGSVVGAGRIELPTSSASRKRSSTELSARRLGDCTPEATPGIEPG